MHNSINNLALINDQIKSNFGLVKNLNIIAVSKTFPMSEINPLIENGHLHFGENKVQEAVDKWTDIKKLNKKVGISLNPESKINLVEKHLDKIDLILIMSVNPGFGGQKFMPEVLEKIKKLNEIKNQKKFNFDIEIDGGINFENSKLAIKAGANILVSGTTIFKSNNGDIKKNIELLRSI